MLASRPPRPPSHYVAAFLTLAFLGCVCPTEALAQTSPTDQSSFWGLGRSWEVKIKITPEVLKALYPEGRTRIGLSQRGRFKYGKASVEIAGHQLAEVGLRFKGNSTYWSSPSSLKKSFKLDFNRFRKGQEFLGLKKLNLHNNVTDPYQIREAVSYQIYRDAGVPSGRTCFARVYLTVAGNEKLQNAYLGSYTMTEQVDKEFLADKFQGEKRGLILKPEGRILPYLGRQWNDEYEAAFIPKTKAKKSHTKPLIELARLVAQKDDEVLVAGVEEVLDVSEFLNYCAVTAFLANLDSPFALAHNFYLGVPHGSKKVVWIPWDLNLSIGGFRMMGSAGSGLSVFKPTSLPLFTRLIAAPKYRKIYEQHLRALATGPGSSESFLGFLAIARKTTKAAIAAETERVDAVTKASGGESGGIAALLARGGRSSRPTGAALDEYARTRGQHVLDQIAGKTEGRAAGSNRMGSFGFRRSTQTREIMAVLRDLVARGQVLKLRKDTVVSEATFTSGIGTLFGKIDTDQDGAITQTELMAEMFNQRGEGASRAEARRVRRQADSDKNRKISKAEWLKLYADSLKQWDADADGKLSAEELKKK
ncbi:MAG: CotH kinase family protein [Planctomycetota bacterium]|nr:CotH kinase family protein [Planctomycetota bacterium]